MKPIRNGLALAVMLALASPVLHAQAPEQETPTTSAQLESVTVTAQRREQQAQDTPVVISVFSAAELERKQVNRVDDLKFFIPNITIDHNTATSSGAKIFLRGVGQDDSIFTADPAVAIYIDDIYIPRQTGSLFDLYDVERVEVLRGPQGTLYGRNATGGAIRYITRRPDGERRLGVDGTFGSLGRKDLRVMFDTPIGNDGGGLSLAALTRNRDGVVREQVSGDKVNDSKVDAARLGLAIPVADYSRLYVNLEGVRERSGPMYAIPVHMEDGRVVPNYGDFHTTRSDLQNGRNDLDQRGASFTLETDFDSWLWRNIAHYRSMDSLLYVDLDGTDQLRYHLFQDQAQHQHGFESQFISQAAGPVEWVAGIFAFRESNRQPTRNDIFARGGTNDISQDTTALAAYAQATWAVNEHLNLTGGGRYSHEKKELSVLARAPDGSEAFFVQRRNTWSKPDWKLVADYHFSPDVMGFVSASTGFKSGGFNGRGTTPETITMFDEETLRSYELGIKSSLGGDRVHLNGTYYYNDYGGLQLSAIDPNGLFVATNATGALIHGFELELQAQVTDAWRIDAAVGTINAKYRNYSEVNRPRFEGRGLKHAPKMQWQLGTSYVQALPASSLVLSAQLMHTDGFYQNQDLSELLRTPAHTLVNARVAWEPDHRNWSLALWGRNLTDRHFSVGGFDIPGLGVAVVYPSMPRTWGVDLSYRFW